MKIEGTPDSAPVRYGPRKLGQTEFNRQKDSRKGRVTAQGVVFGSRKGAAAEPKAPAPEVTSSAAPKEAPEDPETGEQSEEQEEANPFLPQGDDDASGRTTIAELEKILAEDPELLDLAIDAEFKDGTPRKGAVKLLLAAEKAKPEPRENILKLLEGTA